MKRLITKIFTIAACAAMIATVAPTANVQSVQAAVKSQGTVNLATKKLTIPKGKSTAIANNTLQMVKGRRYQLKAKFGATTVTTKGTYKSSKPAVATVSSTGLITAKSPGTTTVKMTYGGKTQSVKIKVVAAHTHSWKTISKATCAVKGKKLCKTCGVTGSTAMKTTHTFEVTKKATCEAKGKQTCSICGATEAIVKKAHKWQTDIWEDVEGRGKAYSVATVFCGGCNIDMTFWTKEERDAHLFNVNNLTCFCANTYGVSDATVYPQYFKVKKTEITCKTCGAWKDKFQEDLYECDNKGNRLVAEKPDETPVTPTPSPVPDTSDETDTNGGTNGSTSDNSLSENETNDNIADPGNGGGDIASGDGTEDGGEHAHEYTTEMREDVEGRGELYTPVTITCDKCGKDLSEASMEEIDSHVFSPRSICFNENLTRIKGEPTYPEYVMVRTETSTCVDCGEVTETRTDLYECDADGDPIVDEPDNGDDGGEDYDGSEGEVVEDE